MGSIRLAKRADLDAVARIYAAARHFMHENGNPTQWPGAYPSRQDAEKDLELDALWVYDEGAGPLGCMSVLPGPDPTYSVIAGEPWLNDDPYWVMHRMAALSSGNGVGSALLSWLCARHDNVRADTHADNLPMQRTLERCGFVRRGTIWIADGSARVAYHYVANDGRCTPSVAPSRSFD